jgi:hypothetical protein
VVENVACQVFEGKGTVKPPGLLEYANVVSEFSDDVGGFDAICWTAAVALKING